MTTATKAPPARAAGNGQARPAGKVFGRTAGILRAAVGVVLYGTGGIGKTSLASTAPGALFIDIEGGSKALNVDRIDGVESWDDLLACLRSQACNDAKSIVIDSGTKAEEWCRAWVVENVKTDKGASVTSIEGYGWGKGFTHACEEWRKLLAEFDRHRSQGRNIVLICHERIGKVPNPNGDDYIRYEPRLQNAKDASIMAATKEWADELLFVSYDVASVEGKGRGTGTRTIYCTETATHMAKTRRLAGDPIAFVKGEDKLWGLLLGTPADPIPADDQPPL